MHSNRESARRSRLRKQTLIQTLEGQVRQLAEEKAILLQQISNLSKVSAHYMTKVSRILSHQSQRNGMASELESFPLCVYIYTIFKYSPQFCLLIYMLAMRNNIDIYSNCQVFPEQMLEDSLRENSRLKLEIANYHEKVWSVQKK